MILDSLFEGVTFDPGFVRGSWERGLELRTVRGGDIKTIIQAEDMTRGREKMIICGVE